MEDQQMYYVWLNEINELASSPKPYNISDLKQIFTSKGTRDKSGRVRLSIAVGTKEQLQGYSTSPNPEGENGVVQIQN